MPHQIKAKLSGESIGRLITQILIDIIMINGSMLIALYLRHDLRIPLSEMRRFSYLWPVMTVICLVAFVFVNLYKVLWQYASVQEGLQIIIGTILGMGSTFIFCLSAYTIYSDWNYFFFTSRTVYPIAWFVLLLFMLFQRFSIRIFKSFNLFQSLRPKKNNRRILIVGAGWGGSALIREFASTGYKYGQPVIIVDDDRKKAGTHISRFPVLYGIASIPEYVKKYAIDEIVIAIPSAKPEQLRAIMEVCTTTKCELKLVPGMRDVTDGQLQLGKMRDVNITDLLYRDEVHLDMDSIRNYITNKTVLVTGGGGSIGSELCRQIANFRPALLIIFDVYENNAFELSNELKMKYGEKLRLETLIGSVRDEVRVEEIFKAYRPSVVFHAAAHKHVPLMEFNPAEAVKNNVFGTLNVAKFSDIYGVKRFVLLSTDKAVNPGNVMGATKRITEMVLQYMGKRSNTRYMAVRFGNVLGSHGSVIFTFMNQIANGGPVTVTHPDITRYFMTIPEAAQLVLQAGAIAETSSIFILDMGTPVKIMDLARNMIRLSGYEPDVDIKIIITGLRPGDKMYEQLMTPEEGETTGTTPHEKIFVVHPPEIDDAAFEEQLEALYACAFKRPENIREMLGEIVPAFKHDSQQSEKNRAG